MYQGKVKAAPALTATLEHNFAQMMVLGSIIVSAKNRRQFVYLAHQFRVLAPTVIQAIKSVNRTGKVTPLVAVVRSHRFVLQELWRLAFVVMAETVRKNVKRTEWVLNPACVKMVSLTAPQG